MNADTRTDAQTTPKCMVSIVHIRWRKTNS